MISDFDHVASSTPKSSYSNGHYYKRATPDSPAFRFSDLVPITPMPKFAEMDTPEVRKQAQQYGIKKTLSKAKLRLKLKEVYEYTHQVRSPTETGEDNASPVGEAGKKKPLSFVGSAISSESDIGIKGHRPKCQRQGHELPETPKKRCDPVVNGTDGARPALVNYSGDRYRPYTFKSKRKGGWGLSPSPEQDSRLGLDCGAGDCPVEIGSTADLNLSFPELRIGDQPCSGIAKQTNVNQSFDDSNQFRHSDLSGVLKMDGANENSVYVIQDPLQTPTKSIAVSCTLEKFKSPGISAPEIPLCASILEDCNEIISLLDSSNETSLRDTEGVTLPIMNSSSGIGSKSDFNNINCNFDTLPDSSRTQNREVTKRLPLPIHLDQEASVKDVQSADVISLLDLSDSSPETAIEFPETNGCRSDGYFSATKKKSKTVTGESDSLKDGGNHKMLPISNSFAHRQSMGSCMDKTYESVDMFDALPRRSKSQKFSFIPEKCELQDVDKGGTSEICSDYCPSFCQNESPLAMSAGTPKEIFSKRNVCPTSRADTSVDTSEEVNSSPHTESSDHAQTSPEDIHQGLEEESSSQDVESGRDELHRSLFTSLHQDSISSSSEEEECKSLMQRLLEKRADKGNLHPKSVTDYKTDPMCAASDSKDFQDTDARNVLSSLPGNESAARLRDNAETTDSPVKKHRKVDFLNTHSKTSDARHKLKKPVKAKKPKLDKHELETAMCRAVRSDMGLYLSILQYKPVYLSRIKKLMHDSNIKVKASDLLEFLDNKGITFSTADENKHKGPRVGKKRTGR